jgi:hypothetical protein
MFRNDDPPVPFFHGGTGEGNLNNEEILTERLIHNRNPGSHHLLTETISNPDRSARNSSRISLRTFEGGAGPLCPAGKEGVKVAAIFMIRAS